MPLIRIDALEDRSKKQVRGVLDAAHRAMLATFKMPQRDRYQIYLPGLGPAVHPSRHGTDSR
jgi:Tautomerase enzyme